MNCSNVHLDPQESGILLAKFFLIHWSRRLISFFLIQLSCVCVFDLGREVLFMRKLEGNIWSLSQQLHQFSAAGSLTEPEDRLPVKQTRRNLQSGLFQYQEHRCSLHLALSSSFFKLIFWFHTNILLKYCSYIVFLLQFPLLKFLLYNLSTHQTPGLLSLFF